MNVKLATLQQEFDTLREKTEGVAWCKKCWWDEDALNLSDWCLLDAWYRSRCLELPGLGESMVPCLDMTNHSSKPNAYYETNMENDVLLLLLPDVELDPGVEITISYGSSKSDAEMLFSYGFIDHGNSGVKELVLTLELPLDDPLGKAKVAAFPGPTFLRISMKGEEDFQFECPFLYLMILNEEDGLEFKMLQQTDGSRSPLHVFWQGADVTESTTDFEDHIKNHPLKDIFKLRAITLLCDRISEQLDRIELSKPVLQAISSDSAVSSERHSAALRLREVEMEILMHALVAADTQVNNKGFPEEPGGHDANKVADG